MINRECLVDELVKRNQEDINAKFMNLQPKIFVMDPTRPLGASYGVEELQSDFHVICLFRRTLTNVILIQYPKLLCPSKRFLALVSLAWLREYLFGHMNLEKAYFGNSLSDFLSNDQV